MPAQIIHKHNRPTISVIIPTLNGSRETLRELIDSILLQSIKSLEIILSCGERPNGHARNVAAGKARGKYLILIDDDVHFSDRELFKKLIRTLELPGVGIAGSGILLPQNMNWIASGYSKFRSFQEPVVEKVTPGRPSHSCMAIKTDLFNGVGRESDTLITGTDDDLRFKVKEAGFKVVIVPKTKVYHYPPDNFKTIIRDSFNKGVGAAYALKYSPHLFTFPRFYNLSIYRPAFVLFYKIAGLLPKGIIYILKRELIRSVAETTQTLGLVYGYFIYHI